MYYVGIDLHKEQSWFYVMKKNGVKVSSNSVSNDLGTLKKYFEKIPKPFKLAVESTYNWYYFVDLAEKYAAEVFLANSYELKAFAKRNKKTDKIDAKLIADVLRKGYLPTVTIPSKEIRNIRELLRYRINIVKERSRNIHQLKNLLARLGEDSNGDFTTYKKIAEIKTEHLSENYQEIIKGYSDKICYLKKKLSETEKYAESQLRDDPEIKMLITIPGISYFSGALIKSEIVDIGRFKSFNRLCSYAGLTPRTHQSANKKINGPLNKNRRKLLQWILIEIVYHFIKAMPDKQKKFAFISKRKGNNTAKVALARDLLKMIYLVLKEKRCFYIKNRLKAASALCGA